MEDLPKDPKIAGLQVSKEKEGCMGSQSVGRQLVFTCALACTVMLSGCGGTKVLKESQPIQTTQPLATVSDQQVTAILDWVIVRDGPGTWAKNADWDEYLLRVSNLSDQPIQVTRVIVVDSLDTRIESQSRRRHLVKGSKKTARRYKESGIKVKAGQGTGKMIVAAAAVTAVGVGLAYGAAGAALMSGAATVGSAGAVAGGLVLVGPAIVLLHAIHNNAVGEEIVLRQTELPLEVSASEELKPDVFFPISPSPGMVELIYTDASGEHSLVIDTSTALDGLHIDTPTE